MEAFVEEELVELVLLVELSELVDLSAMLMFELEVETSDATTSELEGVEKIDVEADLVVTATRTTSGISHIFKRV